MTLAGDPGASVTVSLVWGTRGDAIVSPWRCRSSPTSITTIPLRFTAAADADNGRLEVAGVGTGSFLVGVVSLMPADNLNGFRRDLVEHLKVLDHGTSYRWPGGNMLAVYDWRDGIGDIDRRRPLRHRLEHGRVQRRRHRRVSHPVPPARPEPVHGGQLGVSRRVLRRRRGWSTVNGAAGTPMAGSAPPTAVRSPTGSCIWGIGNEMYGQWQNGHMSIDHYVVKHARFAANG